MKKYILILMIFFCGCAPYSVDALKYTTPQYKKSSQENKFISKENNCEFLGDAIYTSQELAKIYEENYGGVDFTMFEKYAVLANGLIAQKTYDLGGNLYYYPEVYAPRYAYLELMQKKKICAKMYKCKCIYTNCL